MTRVAKADTIVAIATPPGRGALGIVRISGPEAIAIAAAIAGHAEPRRAALRPFCDADGAVIDEGLLLVFPAPHSFTGEDVVELQGHGAPVVLAALAAAAIRHGARPARPGEFSERAFLSGRIDLAQAEAIADLIDASSVQAARAAQRSLQGVFSARVQALVEALTQARIFIEGALDFSDEDIDWLADARLAQRLDGLEADLASLLSEAAQGQRLREGLVVAITGRPNAGKSTLLNALAGVEAAIVTDVPGTTRDVLRENILLDGLPLTLVDTAGLRDTDDVVEREGIRRAWAALEKAELALYVADDRSGLSTDDATYLAQLPTALPRLILLNKCDLSGHAAGALDAHTLRLSAQTGAGLDLLKARLLAAAGLQSTEGVFSARTRHLEALRAAQGFLREARLHLHRNAPAELAAENLRLAQDALGSITGTVTADDLLGRVFAQFCIGK